MVITQLQQKLLQNRQIPESDWEKFLSPDWSRDLLDPFLMKDMKIAVQRILRAIDQKEKIVIFADYDADGIPGAVMWTDFFRQIKFENFSIYIPDRHKEGFGLNEKAVRKIAEQGGQLLITVDCGITNVSEVELADQLKMEVIITDHHLPDKILPKAVAIIDNKQLDDNYPDKMLCGCAVTFKLLSAILATENFGLPKGSEKWWLDLVAISTYSDMVPLLNENRVLLKYGLIVLQKTRRVGLQSLLNLAKIDLKHLSETDIAFTITPRINAASRMGQTELAYRLLATNDELEAKALANELEKLNRQRKTTVAQIAKAIKKELQGREEKIKRDQVIVLGNRHWQPALLGLVANNLVTEYDVPVFLWGQDGAENIKGSCRSNDKISIVEIMRQITDDYFLDCGGHHQSGGFSVAPDKIFDLEDLIIEAVSKQSKEENIVITKSVSDTSLKLDEVNNQLWQEIFPLSPFGQENPQPIFEFTNVTPQVVEIFGKEKNHLKVIFHQQFGQKIEAIAFFADKDSFQKELKAGETITLLASLEKSYFGRNEQLRLRIVEVR